MIHQTTLIIWLMIIYDYILYIQYNDVSLFVRSPMLQKLSSLTNRPSCGEAQTNHLERRVKELQEQLQQVHRKFWANFYQPFIPVGHPKMLVICRGFFSPNMPETFRFRNDKQFCPVDVGSLTPKSGWNKQGPKMPRKVGAMLKWVFPKMVVPNNHWFSY